MSFPRPVVIMQMPEELGSTEVLGFMQDLKPLIESECPRIVFDCSEVRYVDGAGAQMIRQCLEEAAKRDGDLRLAALAPETEQVLRQTQKTPSYQFFASAREAVHSFNAVPLQGKAKSATSVSVFPDVGAFDKAS